MYEHHRQEHQRRRDQDDSQRQPGRQCESDDVEHHDVPDSRKTAEPPVVGLHAGVGEIKRARQRQDEASDHTIGLRHHLRPQQHRRRHEDIGDEIDDEVELRAIIALGPFLDRKAPRQRPVDRVDHQSDAKPDESLREIAGEHRLQRQQPERSA
jgi:hypothetical protein